MKNNIIFTSNGIIGTKFPEGFINQHIYPHYNKEDTIGIKKILEYKEKILTLNDGDYIII